MAIGPNSKQLRTHPGCDSLSREQSNTMSSNSYKHLREQLQDLIAKGKEISSREAGSQSEQIHEWVERAHDCLSLLETHVPTALSDFRKLREAFEFKVQVGEEYDCSNSAYNPSWIDPVTGVQCWADVLIDFRFDRLAHANKLLVLAAAKLELDGYSIHSTPPLSADSQTEPPIECAPTLSPLGTTSFAFSAADLKSARSAIKVTQEQAAHWFQITSRQYKRWESGKQKGMHAQHHLRLQAFLEWAKQGTMGVPPNVP